MKREDMKIRRMAGWMVRRAEGEECQGKVSPKEVSNALKRKHKLSVTAPQFS
jgi:hypothetical protein